MIVQEIPGSARVRTLAADAGVLRRAMEVLHAAGAGSLDQAFAALLAWLRDEVAAGRLHADPPLRALLLAVSSARPAAALRAALDGFEAGQALVARLQDLQDEIPFLFRVDKDGLPRLRTLGELAGHAPARLRLGWSTESSQAPGAPAFTITAGAEAGVALAVLDAATLAERHGAVLVPASDVALVLETSGTLHGDVRLALASGSLQASTGQTLALVFEFAPQETALAALVHVASRLPRTLDLASLAAALGLPGQDGLRQVGISGESSLAFDLSGRRRGSGIAIRTVGVQGQRRRIQRTVSAGASLELVLEDRGQRQRRIHRDASAALVLQSERRDEERVDARGELDAGIRLTGWGTLAADLVAASLPDAAPLLEQLDAFTQPQALLQQALRRRLPATLAALAPVLTGEAQGRAANDALRHAVADALLSRFDLWHAVAGRETTALAARLTAELAGSAAGAAVAAELRSWLERTLEALSVDARARLQQFAAELVRRRQARPLQEALEAVGFQAARAARGTAALVQPLLEFLQAYGAWRAKLVDASRDALNLRLALSVAWNREHAASDAVEQQLRIPVAALSTPAAAADFQRWLQGRAFADPTLPFGVPAASVQGSWHAVATRYSELGETLALDLGFTGIRSRTLLKADTRVEAGPGGVLLARSRASAARTRSWGKDKVHAVGRALFDALAGEGALGQFSLDLEFTERALSRDELQGLLASLATPHLLDAAQAEALHAARDALAATQGGDPAARLTLGMALGKGERRRLAELAGDALARRRAIASALALAGSGRRSRNLVEAMQALGYSGDPVEAFVHHWDGLRRKLSGGPIASVTLNGWHITRSQRSSPLYRAAVQLKHCMGAAAAMDEVLQAVASWPHTEAMLQPPAGGDGASGDAAQAAALADQRDQRASEFAADFARVLSTHDVAFDSGDDVPVFSLFLLILLARLGGSRLKARLRA